MVKHITFFAIWATLMVISETQRRGPPVEDYDVDDRGSSNRRPNMDVGQFPFKRGERAIFHFDQGDEGFIGTIPGLIKDLDKIKNVMNQQRKITQAFGEAFDQCEACG